MGIAVATVWAYWKFFWLVLLICNLKTFIIYDWFCSLIDKTVNRFHQLIFIVDENKILEELLENLVVHSKNKMTEIRIMKDQYLEFESSWNSQILNLLCDYKRNYSYEWIIIMITWKMFILLDKANNNNIRTPNLLNREIYCWRHFSLCLSAVSCCVALLYFCKEVGILD